jgi:hypothetical protein
MKVIFVHYFGGLDRFSHSFVFVAHFVFLRDVWIQTQRSSVTQAGATELFISLKVSRTELIFFLTLCSTHAVQTFRKKS